MACVIELRASRLREEVVRGSRPSKRSGPRIARPASAPGTSTSAELAWPGRLADRAARRRRVPARGRSDVPRQRQGEGRRPTKSARGTSGCSARTRGSSCALCGAARASRLRGGRVDTMSSAPWRPSPARPTTPRATSASSLRSPGPRGGGRDARRPDRARRARGRRLRLRSRLRSRRGGATVGARRRLEGRDHRAPVESPTVASCRVRTDEPPPRPTWRARPTAALENGLRPEHPISSVGQTQRAAHAAREPPVEPAEHDDIRHQIEPDEEDDGAAERLEAVSSGRGQGDTTAISGR